MDLGISGRSAIVCASSQGLGRACAEALVAEGVAVVINGRDAAKLETTAAEIRATTAGAVVAALAADITTPEGRAALLAACPDADILVTNNVGPQPGSISEVTDEDLARALDLHYWAPITLVRAVLPGMVERRFGRIVNITSAMVTRPSGQMVASAGARAGLTAVMKGVSLEVAEFNVTINNLLPERIDSPRQEHMAHVEMERSGITYDEARRRQAAALATKRLGRPAELGAACAFLCSVQAGFISGVNLHLDGGSYPGLV
ncbi:MAG TPA: SDR family oxidoreductase [Ilumatobacteraceae bacterium]|jgi:3-oxoacyl-[acyl-carrier protein] reductase